MQERQSGIMHKVPCRHWGTNATSDWAPIGAKSVLSSPPRWGQRIPVPCAHASSHPPLLLFAPLPPPAKKGNSEGTGAQTRQATGHRLVPKASSPPLLVGDSEFLCPAHMLHLTHPYCSSLPSHPRPKRGIAKVGRGNICYMYVHGALGTVVAPPLSPQLMNG
ncbi:hypothetical protein niasHT_029240 [Heterodera trifolii]|uniref:Uncharacterized protein n=1 Tax=Heterodera trifolii TaxID=157864 RepID=A0ABD2JA84_9BILA